MTEPERPARIFLSSRQRPDSAEAAAIRDLAARLHDDLGFDVSLGIERSAPRGVPDDVRDRLENAEYFILVDFDLSGETDRKAKGLWNRSLFSHQEFAIAVFLGLNHLVFVEKGLTPPDGIWAYVVRPSPIEFVRATVADTVLAAVRSKLNTGPPRQRWSNAWRRELRISRTIRRSDDVRWVRYGNEGSTLRAKYFLVDVRNEHRDRTATDAHAYLERIVEKEIEVVGIPHPLPLKWNALKTEATAIPPKFKTGFSALFMLEHEPTVARIGINPFLLDSNSYDNHYIVRGRGEYELHFAVFSREFPPARRKMLLRLGISPDDTELVDLDPSTPPGSTVPP